MRKIDCIIKPFKLDDIKSALHELGISGMTVSEIHGFGRQKGHTELYRGAEYQTELIPKIKIELVIPANQIDVVTTTLRKEARTGNVGDGKIFVIPIDKSLRIRTGETGAESL